MGVAAGCEGRAPVMNAPAPDPQNAAESDNHATVPPGAEQEGGENQNRSGNGQQQGGNALEDVLVGRAADDPGAPFEEVSLRLLAELRDKAPAAYERTIARLKRAGVRISKLEALLAP